MDEISDYPSNIRFSMIYLDCDALKIELTLQLFSNLLEFSS